MPYSIEPSDALVVVDPQNDFLPGGKLAVADGFRIFEPINRIGPHFRYVVASRDWHPKNHTFFIAQGGPWPPHCVAGTTGALFSPLLHVEHIDAIVNKGVDPESDGYSAFAETDLAVRLRIHGISRIFIAGLATDYCIKMTAIEAAQQGFVAVVLTDAVAAVGREPGDERAAYAEMNAAGIELATSHDIHWSEEA